MKILLLPLRCENQMQQKMLSQGDMQNMASNLSRGRVLALKG